MGIASRRRQIQEYLSEHDMLTVDDAVQLFGASPATIRRDFQEISVNGGARRIRGGICRRIDEHDNMIPLTLREKWYSAEKRYLAWQLYNKYLKDVRSFFIDGGSTTAHLGMFLKDPEQVVITNSLPLCNIIREMFPSGGGPQIITTGGRLYPGSGLLLGPQSEAAAAAYHAEVTVLSARGITASGIYNHNELIAGINLRMIENSDKVVLIADHSKIGVAAMHKVCPLHKIEALFTVETAENREILAEIRAAGVKVFCNSYQVS
ncbi:MAG: DeoR/GlpR transcriptional regulator [Lentisphaeria bacterium]|nr:DeoR/GlpR transcriptional regulator [Lentisphaeria bacterium]